MSRLCAPLCIGFFHLLKMGQLSLGPSWDQRNAKFIHALAACAKSWKLLGCYNSSAQRQIRLLYNTAAPNWQAVFSPPPLLIMQIRLFSGMGLARLIQNLRTLTTVSSASTNSKGGWGFSICNWTHAKLHTKPAAPQNHGKTCLCQ